MSTGWERLGPLEAAVRHRWLTIGAVTYLVVAETAIGGYQNTGRDLVANMLGACLAGWLVSRRPNSQEPSYRR